MRGNRQQTGEAAPDLCPDAQETTCYVKCLQSVEKWSDIVKQQHESLYMDTWG